MEDDETMPEPELPADTSSVPPSTGSPAPPEAPPSSPSKTWEWFCQYTGVIVAPLALVVSLLGFWTSHDASRRTTQVEVSQVLAEAWDLMGGEVGTTTITDPVRDPQILERARRLIQDTALVKDPKSSKAYTALAAYWGASKNPTKQLEALRDALELDATDATAHNNLGVALAEQGEPEAAIAAYRKALEFDSSYATAHNNLGFALFQQLELEAAIAAFRRALELNPAFASTYSHLGDALLPQGDLEEVNAAFRKALGLEPELKQSKDHLALDGSPPSPPPSP